MSVINRPARKAALVVAGAVALAALAGGVGYAAGSGGSDVKACVNGAGRLGLQSNKGKCGKGFTSVSIAKQGPRGATGATGKAGAAGKAGATGKTGPQGPGAVDLHKAYFFNGHDNAVTVDGVTYVTDCDSSGTGSSFKVAATLTVQPATGITANLVGLVSRGTGDTVSSTSAVPNSSTVKYVDAFATNPTDARTYVQDVQVELSNGKTQLVSMRIVANPKQPTGGQFPFFPTICSFDGVITPAA